jgi:ABC-2 type transport system permease protein
MNSQPDAQSAMPAAVNRSQVLAPGATSWSNCMYWSIRRELWEYRSVYLVPLGVAALYLVGFLFNALHLIRRVHASTDTSLLHPGLQIEPYDFGALVIMGATLIVAAFYCLDALYGERRDRSILFWKSLPVSDLTAVLSKASIPLLVLPAIMFSVSVALQVLMLPITAAVLLGSGHSVAPFWNHLALFHRWATLFAHLFVIHSLWYAPLYGWMLLVSSWARRAPFLWAALPLFAISILEKLVFNTWHFAGMLGSIIGGVAEPAPAVAGAAAHDAVGLTIHTNPGTLTSPQFWIGLIVTAAFLAAAVRLRRNRGPI